MKAAKVLAWAAAAQLVFMAVTGVYLFLWYRPNPSIALFDFGADVDASVRIALVVGSLHALDARLLVATSVALAIALAVEHASRGLVTAWALLAVSAAATFTGLLLPWDQLALRAVQVGTNMSGYRPIFDDQARFVLISNSEISTSTLIRWLLLHIALGVVAVACAARTMWVLRFSRAREASST